MRLATCIFFQYFLLECVKGFPEQGKWNAVINETHPLFGVYKSVFKGSKILLRINCVDLTDNLTVGINWELRETPCWEEYWRLDLVSPEDRQNGWKYYYGVAEETRNGEFQDHVFFKPPNDYVHRCDSTIHLTEFAENCTHISAKSPVAKRSTSETFKFEACKSDSDDVFVRQVKRPVFTIPKDGVYLFILRIDPQIQQVPSNFKAEVIIEIKGEHGYLSATEYPLFIFYGASCILYTFYGIVWLTMSFMQWRDLIRIQFWIGAVILLGMIEMAVFYAEYYSINSTGMSVTGAVLVAEIISCAKRTLARMLVVIVSIGFGIVKPRLGATLHRILVVGALYFGLASFEASLRVLHPVNGPSNKALMAGVPLSVLDAGIFYWIFQSLMATTRTLRLRRNLVKLNLYRHFTNTLIFAVIASIIFMIWSIRYLKTAECLRNWQEIWTDEAYWHVLFSLILLVIMILWRPSNNNQRFSFSPLIDNIDDEEEEDLVINAAFSGNMKLRPKKNGNSNGKSYNRSQSVEDELRWVEENIPADLGEGDLPALDSEEELLSTKFELSKMQ